MFDSCGVLVGSVRWGLGIGRPGARRCLACVGRGSGGGEVGRVGIGGDEGCREVLGDRVPMAGASVGQVVAKCARYAGKGCGWASFAGREAGFRAPAGDAASASFDTCRAEFDVEA